MPCVHALCTEFAGGTRDLYNLLLNRKDMRMTTLSKMLMALFCSMIVVSFAGCAADEVDESVEEAEDAL